MNKHIDPPWGSIPRKKGGHYCVLDSDTAQAGPAIEYCFEEDTDEGAGCFWAGNGEYESQVNFCPVCGQKAPRGIDDVNRRRS